ncbi:TMV resistance protein N [Spatholobus suberectus]|nr:TMV resistance protein N [Spatholobus suberectus]
MDPIFTGTLQAPWFGLCTTSKYSIQTNHTVLSDLLVGYGPKGSNNYEGIHVGNEWNSSHHRNSAADTAEKSSAPSSCDQVTITASIHSFATEQRGSQDQRFASTIPEAVSLVSARKFPQGIAVV